MAFNRSACAMGTAAPILAGINRFFIASADSPADELVRLRPASRGAPQRRGHHNRAVAGAP